MCVKIESMLPYLARRYRQSSWSAHQYVQSPWNDYATIPRMQPYSPVDYTGDGHQHTLSSILGIKECKWFQVSGIAIATTPGHVGDSTIEAAGGGFLIAEGFGKVFPPVPYLLEMYDLESIYIILNALDVAQIGAVR